MYKLADFFDEVKLVWKWLQDFLSLDGGLFVDAFAVVFLVRLLAPLRGFPPLTMAEAGMWGVTIASFAYSNTPKS